MAPKGTCHIGTSGFHYQHWKGPFYAEDFPEKEFLAFYARHFKTVEINNSFYHLPHPETFDQWRQTAGSNFTFAVKASRYITHMKKLKDPQKTLTKFFDAAAHLEGKLGPILFQLPPHWHVNSERLETFLKALPANHRYAFEFRDDSWFTDEIYDLLTDSKAAFCIYDMGGEVTPRQVTADFVYVRLHGPAAKYQGNYTKHQLNPWARHFQDWMKAGKDIYCYFNNDVKGYAVKNAQTLRDIVDS